MGSPSSAAAANWLEELSLAPDARTRRRLLFDDQNTGSQNADQKAIADRLYDEVLRLVRIDLTRASRVAQAAEWLAAKWRDEYIRAQSLRARGYVFYLTANYRRACEKHQAALKIFGRLNLDIHAARTISSMLQPLIYLGRYKRAFALAARARKIFHKHNDHLRLARLDSNVGNILHRLDRFTEGLAHYERAHKVFRELGQVADVPFALHNMAMCYTGLNRFDEALQTYGAARDLWREQNKPLLVAEADYNIAYLHYMRGEYTRAIELYQRARGLYQELGDDYHTALCDLDESEMYVELNLSEEAGTLARRAFAGFRKLRINYEAAKALTFQAMAARQQGHLEQARKIFWQARKLFVQETNLTWCALIDIHEALVLMEQGERKKARQLCDAALLYFRRSALHSRAALCELLLARLDAEEGNLTNAERHCRAAFRQIAKTESPAVEFQASFTLGQLQEAMGKTQAAYRSFQSAHARLEGLRSHLQGEEFKIAFLKDKVSLYESLVLLSVSNRRGAKGHETAFDFVERAKSRSLADLIAFQVTALQPKVGRDPKLSAQLQELERQLISTQHQTRREELQAGKHSGKRIEKLRRRSRAYQSEIKHAISGLASADWEFASLLSAGTVPLEAIRSTIPADCLLVEYYQVRGRICAFVLGGGSLDFVPLGSAHRVRDIFRLLQFQLSKFRLGEEYARNFSPELHAATQTHLRDLHVELIAPLRKKLQARHLILVPHGFLHYLPFHALWDGEQYLCDEFGQSYAPSASVYSLCSKRQVAPHQGSLVLGIPDRLAPNILDEACAVAAALPHSRLFIGDDATKELLFQYAPSSRFIHIATHGLFRQDNPMFSSIRLGQSDLNLFDLYQLKLSAELVTLSGCGTGLNVVVGGDELLGLVRGLLYAGTQAVLATLWDVHDESTAVFMKKFYEKISEGETKAASLRFAMKDLRLNYPHPYHWAPFVLIGKFDKH